MNAPRVVRKNPFLLALDKAIPIKDSAGAYLCERAARRARPCWGPHPLAVRQNRSPPSAGKRIIARLRHVDRSDPVRNVEAEQESGVLPFF